MKNIASCHCGAVQLEVAHFPTEVTDCNCSLCRSYGVLWAYYCATDILSLPESSLTDTYAWAGRNVDFHRCKNCGCITHWVPRDPTRDKRGVNARLFPATILADAQVNHRDGAHRGKHPNRTTEPS